MTITFNADTGINAATATQGFQVPLGTTAQRNASPTNGEMRWNTTLNVMEVWTGATWTTLISSSYTITYLLVAGGGGGAGGYEGGGGGAGGLLYGTYAAIPTTPYTITIGAGGTGGRRRAGLAG